MNYYSFEILIIKKLFSDHEKIKKSNFFILYYLHSITLNIYYHLYLFTLIFK